MKEIRLVRTPSRKLNVSIDEYSLYGVVAGGIRSFISKSNGYFVIKLVSGLTTSDSLSLFREKTLENLINIVVRNKGDLFQFDNTNEFLLWLTGRNGLGTKIEFLETETLSLTSEYRMFRYYAVEGGGLKCYITQQTDGLYTVKTPFLILDKSYIATGYSINEVMTKLLSSGYKVWEFETYSNLFKWLEN